jgi:hypothetical protein
MEVVSVRAVDAVVLASWVGMGGMDGKSRKLVSEVWKRVPGTQVSIIYRAILVIPIIIQKINASFTVM